MQWAQILIEELTSALQNHRVEIRAHFYAQISHLAVWKKILTFKSWTAETVKKFSFGSCMSLSIQISWSMVSGWSLLARNCRRLSRCLPLKGIPSYAVHFKTSTRAWKKNKSNFLMWLTWDEQDLKTLKSYFVSKVNLDWKLRNLDFERIWKNSEKNGNKISFQKRQLSYHIWEVKH